MRFYFEGYAEVLHLVTTLRPSPRPEAARRSGLPRPGETVGTMGRLWATMIKHAGQRRFAAGAASVFSAVRQWAVRKHTAARLRRSDGGLRRSLDRR